MNKLDQSHQTLVLDPSFSGIPVTIEILEGSRWTQPMQAGPFVFNILPQIVIWAEDVQGNLIETLYVTGADGKGFRHAGKKEKGSLFYRESFPLWAKRMEKEERQLPSNENPYPDSVTSATPESGFSIETLIPDPGEVIILRLEINQSDDRNSFYTKDNNSWVGQPALIYESVIDFSEIQGSYSMELIGHSGLISDNAAVYRELSQFDTALEQLTGISVSF